MSLAYSFIRSDLLRTVDESSYKENLPPITGDLDTYANSRDDISNHYRLLSSDSVHQPSRTKHTEGITTS